MKLPIFCFWALVQGVDLFGAGGFFGGEGPRLFMNKFTVVAAVEALLCSINLIITWAWPSAKLRFNAESEDPLKEVFILFLAFEILYCHLSRFLSIL